MEQPLTSKQNILGTFDCFNVKRTGLIHSCKVSGIYQNTLSGFQLIFLTVAINFQECHAISGDSLHNKAFTAKQALSQTLLKIYREIQPFFHGQQSPLLNNNAISGSHLIRNDGTGKA